MFRLIDDVLQKRGRMKSPKIRRLLVISTIVLVLFAALMLYLQRGQDKLVTGVKDTNYDLAILDQGHIATFNIEEDQLVPVEKIERGDQLLGFYSDRFKRIGNRYFAVSKERGGESPYLSRIGEDLSFLQIKGDSFTNASDEEHYYSALAYTDRLELYKYDQDFQVVKKETIPKAEPRSAYIPTQIVVVDEFLYVLVASGSWEGDTFILNTYLRKMDKDFTLLEEHSFENAKEDIGTLYRMAFFEGKLYISEIDKGETAAGEPGPAWRIIVFDPATKSQEFLQLKTPYPRDIYIDEVNRNLVISNFESFVPNFTWTILSLDDLEETVLTFPEHQSSSHYVMAPFFQMKDGEYYFMFADELVHYNASTWAKTHFDLTALGIKNAQTLIVR